MLPSEFYQDDPDRAQILRAIEQVDAAMRHHVFASEQIAQIERAICYKYFRAGMNMPESKKLVPEACFEMEVNYELWKLYFPANSASGEVPFPFEEKWKALDWGRGKRSNVQREYNREYEGIPLWLLPIDGMPGAPTSPVVPQQQGAVKTGASIQPEQVNHTAAASNPGAAPSPKTKAAAPSTAISKKQPVPVKPSTSPSSSEQKPKETVKTPGPANRDQSKLPAGAAAKPVSPAMQSSTSTAIEEKMNSFFTKLSSSTNSAQKWTKLAWETFYPDENPKGKPFSVEIPMALVSLVSRDDLKKIDELMDHRVRIVLTQSYSSDEREENHVSVEFKVRQPNSPQKLQPLLDAWQWLQDWDVHAKDKASSRQGATGLGEFFEKKQRDAFVSRFSGRRG